MMTLAVASYAMLLDAPTLSEIILAVTTFVTEYAVFIAAGAVVGLAVFGVVRLIKGSR